MNLLAWARWSRASLVFVGVDEAAVRDDLLAADEEPGDAVWAREHQAGDRVLGPAELEPVRPPDGEIRLLAGLDRADVVAREHLSAAAGAQPRRLARGQRLRAAAAAGDQQRLLDLESEVAPLVRGRSVDAESDRDACVHELPHRSDACTEPQVRRRAVSDAGAGRGKPADLVVRQVDAVRAPRRRPANRGSRGTLDRRAAVELFAVLLLLQRLRQVRRGAGDRGGARALPTPPSAAG